MDKIEEGVQSRTIFVRQQDNLTPTLIGPCRAGAPTKRAMNLTDKKWSVWSTGSNHLIYRKKTAQPKEMALELLLKCIIERRVSTYVFF